jgi:hypothetical protein
MSFKFENNSKKYWAKEFASKTKVYLLEKKGCSELVLTVDGKSSEEELVKFLTVGK